MVSLLLDDSAALPALAAPPPAPPPAPHRRAPWKSVRAAQAALLTLTAICAMQAWLDWPPLLGQAGWDVIYGAGFVGAAALCWLRVWILGEERLAWGFMAAGLTSYSLGEVYWITHQAAPASPSPADAGWLGFYLSAYVAIVLLLRSRVDRFPKSMWLDGLIAAVSLAAISSVFVLAPTAAGADGGFAAVAISLAYPIGDLLLGGLVLGVFALLGWQPGRAWLALAAGLAVFGATDSVYVAWFAGGSFQPGTILDAGWLAGVVLIAVAAWRPSSDRRHPALVGWPVLMLPMLFASTSLALLLYGDFHPVGAGATILAAAALTLTGVRTALTFREVRALAGSRQMALTDELTGLDNRRSLIADLGKHVASPERPFTLALLDLDGFKQHNDAFGHTEGDLLLQRLAARLRSSLVEGDKAYRLGGDEFCVISHRAGAADGLTSNACAALSEFCPDYGIWASGGSVSVPGEARTVEEAMRIADTRMYERKNGRAMLPNAQLEVIHRLALAAECRDDDTGEHTRRVGELAALIGAEMGLPGGQLALLRDAAPLHDVGKIGVPDAILLKPSRLTDDEYAQMQVHTTLGAEMLAGGRSLSLLAMAEKIALTHHERWDGGGYPAGTAGSAIPLVGRIAAVADMFDALTHQRVYKVAWTQADAVAEIERESGRRFDPDVVEAFVRALPVPVSTRAPHARRALRA